MLEASSEHHHHHHRHNLSRVCGHGHIKKFWLMQTQKETESEDVTRNQTNRILEENKLTPLSSNCQNSYFSCGDDSPTGGSISTSGNNEDQLSARDALVNRDFIDSSAQPLSVSERLEVSSGTDCRDNIKIVASHSDRESTCKAGYTQVAREFAKMAKGIFTAMKVIIVRMLNVFLMKKMGWSLQISGFPMGMHLSIDIVSLSQETSCRDILMMIRASGLQTSVHNV